MNVNSYSALQLAYLGDAVFELCVREKLIKDGATPVNNLHKYAVNLVKAESQAAMYRKLISFTTKEEQAVLKRGRNAKAATKAKNSSLIDYRHATGLEALFGYLFLKGESDRIKELFDICVNLEV